MHFYIAVPHKQLNTSPFCSFTVLLRTTKIVGVKQSEQAANPRKDQKKQQQRIHSGRKIGASHNQYVNANNIAVPVKGPHVNGFLG
jgi:hypothetical protein